MAPLRTATLIDGLARAGGTQFQSLRLNEALTRLAVNTTFVTGHCENIEHSLSPELDVIEADTWTWFRKRIGRGQQRQEPASPSGEVPQGKPSREASRARRLSPIALEISLRMTMRRRFDLLHLHGVYSRDMLSAAVRYAHLRRVPLVVKITNEPERTWGWRTERLDELQAADAIVTVNEGARRFFAERLRTRVELIPNGVQLQPRVDADGPDLIFVGRLIEQKGVDVLLEAWRAARDAFRRLVIVGEGACRAQLEAQARAAGFGDSVSFEGLQVDPLRYYRSARVLVLPSRWEGMPNVLLEAMSMGLPCVASRIDGVTDLIEDGVHGVLVAPEDPGELSRALIQLAGSGQRRALGDAARARIAQSFTFDAIATRYRALYDELLRSPPRA